MEHNLFLGDGSPAGIKDICNWWNMAYPGDIFCGGLVEKDLQHYWQLNYPNKMKLRETNFAPEIIGIRFLMNNMATIYLSFNQP